MKTPYVPRAILILLLAAGATHAEEGSWSQRERIELEATRRATYRSDGAAAAEASIAPVGKPHAGTPRAKANAGAVRKTIAQSHRAALFDIYEVRSTLLADRDGDGYHREFRIRFDADTSADEALVYARLYLRRLGEAQWLLYHVTNDFWIEGASDDDDYFVRTTLDVGYATDDYDVLIDLHESFDDGLVATIGPNGAPALGLLPLEESGLDAPIEIGGYAIQEVETTLLIDDDDDEFYSRFRIRFDPDAEIDGVLAYARIWVRPQGGEWIEEHVTEDFVVDASGDADAYTLTADWLEGYPTAYYDVQIDVYDAATNLLAATAGSERAALSRLPLEDAARDVRPTPPVDDGVPGESHSREGGGGAASLWTLLLLALARATAETRALRNWARGLGLGRGVRGSRRGSYARKSDQCPVPSAQCPVTSHYQSPAPAIARDR